MAEAVEAMRAALDAGIPGVLGIHLEGPFISPERKGVHNPAFMRPMEDEDIAIMTSLKKGRTLVTLAPERNGMDAIARLAAAGVLVCAGHTASDYATVMEADPPRAARLHASVQRHAAAWPDAIRAPWARRSTAGTRGAASSSTGIT